MSKKIAKKISVEKCQSADCGEPAVLLVMWPGQPTRMCIECSKAAMRVNEAIGGTPLPLIPLDTPVFMAGRIAEMELRGKNP